MLEIRKGNPWIFWPSSICDSLPENPADKLLNGKHSYKIELSFTLLDNSSDKKTLFCILPKYSGIDIEKEKLFLLVGKEDKTEFYNLDYDIYPHKKTHILYEYIYSEKLCITINNKLIKEVNLTEPLGFDENPHIILGSGNFPKNGFNLNYTDVNFHEFKFYSNGELLSNHDFEEFIFDKSVDKTTNCNFIHKL
jgi:hypothetical protein